MIRTLWVWIFGAIATMSLSSLVVIGSLVGAPARLYTWIARTWGRVLLWAGGVQVEVQGA